ncbi:hypothetical protein C8J57DRAFT_1507457 [Mycena rebaudengoi]|nr:hypothetical protein C8J57DRAFT_1507457 [Mycena rebaudengoi]
MLQNFLGETAAHYTFMANLSTMIQLLSAPANGILTLEGQNTTCADVFYVWVAIAWHLEKTLSNSACSAGAHRNEVIKIYNARFLQMMTESSSNIFLLAYFLHPKFRKFGGLQLTMPTQKNGEKLQPSEYPTLYATLFRAAMQILKGEQQRANAGGREEVIQLKEDFLRYAYNQAPFDDAYWDTETKPLDYWTKLSKDSNAKQISRISIKIFSILPSEICDERTASRLGWFNAARRSSMLPENLIGCAQLYEFYTHGISEGDYSHTPNVVLSDVYTGAGTTVTRSAPTLMDLINEENVSPSMADKEAYDELLFNHPDPFDLAETERVSFTDSQVPSVVRSHTRFAITEYIKLESSALAELLQPTKPSTPATASAMDTSDSIQAGHPDDWSLDDFLA